MREDVFERIKYHIARLEKKHNFVGMTDKEWIGIAKTVLDTPGGPPHLEVYVENEIENARTGQELHPK